MTDPDIVRESIRALGALYYTAMLEELRVFDVADRIVESFLDGVLPLRDAGTSRVEKWLEIRESPSRNARLALYTQAFGLGGGDGAEPSPNREFSTLWQRFMAAVVALIERDQGSHLTHRVSVDQEHVRAAARALALNLSEHRAPAAMTVRVQQQTQAATDMLSDVEIQKAYGARDVAQIIERVSTAELGKARNTARGLTMAKSGAKILAWLAAHGPDFSANPIDADLLNACEQWVTAAAMHDDRIDDCSSP